MAEVSVLIRGRAAGHGGKSKRWVTHWSELAGAGGVGLLSSLIIMGASLSAHAVQFIPLGDLSGGAFYSYATGVSADGSVVVGYSDAVSGNEAFRWTRIDGMVGLGYLAGGGTASRAYGVSADGSVVVGWSDSSSGTQAFRWTQSTGMTSLGVLPPGNFGEAYGVSADGSVVVGVNYSASRNYVEAFRWQDGVMTGLGYETYARGVSADGSVVVGTGGLDEAVRWEGGVMTGLRALPHSTISHALGVSADGSVVVGVSGEAFRWTEATGMVGLGDFPGGFSSSAARGVSADGSIVVGSSYSSLGYEAFVWDQTYGMRSLREVLVNTYSLSSQLVGWNLTAATAISADGRTIVGYGTNPSGYTEAWLVGGLGPVGRVPEPATGYLLGMGILGLAGLARRRR
jgi:probable HAF family extracellular repeat protein